MNTLWRSRRSCGSENCLLIECQVREKFLLAFLHSSWWGDSLPSTTSWGETENVYRFSCCLVHLASTGRVEGNSESNFDSYGKEDEHQGNKVSDLSNFKIQSKEASGLDTFCLSFLNIKGIIIVH